MTPDEISAKVDSFSHRRHEVLTYEIPFEQRLVHVESADKPTVYGLRTVDTWRIVFVGRLSADGAVLRANGPTFDVIRRFPHGDDPSVQDALEHLADRLDTGPMEGYFA